MLAAIKGYRTIIVAILVIAYGVAGAAGVDVPASDNSFSLAITGLLMAIMRYFTDTSIGSSQ
ncbi:MAG TPA: hypothetical protein VIU40_14055 [Geobacteraceae bacterium]